MKRHLLTLFFALFTLAPFAGQDFPTSATNDSLPDHLDDLETRTDTLRSNFSGASSPSSPVAGQFHYDTDDDTVYAYDGASWNAIATAGGAAGSGNFLAYNNSGANIAIDQIVYFSGNNSGTGLPEITEAASPGNFPFGVTTAAINNGSSGAVKFYGYFITAAFDASTATVGDAVYFDGSGDFSLTDTGSIQIGFVVDNTNPAVLWLAMFALSPDTVYKGAESLLANASGGALTGGTMVRVTGVDSRGYPQVSAISAVDQAAAFYIPAGIANGERGVGVFFGAKTTALNTSGATVGDKVYYSAAGALTLTASGSRSVGTVASVATSGVVMFNTAGNTAGDILTPTQVGIGAIDTSGIPLTVSVDDAPSASGGVEVAATFVNNSVGTGIATIQLEGSAGAEIDFVDYGVGVDSFISADFGASSLTLDAGAGNATTVINGSSLSVDTDTLYVDGATDRVGINDATPSFSLDVTGTANVTGATTLGSDLTVTGGHLLMQQGALPFLGTSGAYAGGDIRVRLGDYNNSTGGNDTYVDAYDDTQTVTINASNIDVTTGNLDVVSGALQTGGTTRLSNSGALSNITTIGASGTITATAGDIVATAGDVTITAGDLNVTAGDIVMPVDGDIYNNAAATIRFASGSIVLNPTQGPGGGASGYLNASEFRIREAVTMTDQPATILSIVLGASGGPTISRGTGSPESVVTAPVGSLFLRTDGGASTTLYVKESGTGSTGWIAK